MCDARVLVVGVEAGLRGLEIRPSEPPDESKSGGAPAPHVHVQQASPSSSPFDQPSPSESVVHAEDVQPLHAATLLLPDQREPPPPQFEWPHA
eukprot:5827376-Prymnesium_polylepis.1